MTSPPLGLSGSLRATLRAVCGPDNPFLQLSWRQTRRRGEPWQWLPTVLLTALALLLWLRWGERLDAGPFPQARWMILVAAHAALVVLATGIPAWRMMADAQHAGNATSLRLSRLRPLECIAAKAALPLAAGLRVLLAGWPVYLVMALLPGPAPPPLAGVAAVLFALLVYALCLAAAGGAAAVRSRNATVDNWTDFIFNVRTLAAWFLNPAWVFLMVIILGPATLRLAETMSGWRGWFAWRLPGAVLFVPLACWVWRQAAGLAGEVYGEGPALARRVVLGLGTAYLLFALLVIGFNWTTAFDRGALVTWWEVMPTRENSAHLLLALLLAAAYPLPVVAAYAAMLSTGLRAGTADGDERLPVPLPALTHLAAHMLPALALPWLAWWLSLRLGGWPTALLAPAAGHRLFLLQVLAATVSVETVLLLVLSSRFHRAVREVTALAVMLPPLVGPFLLRVAHPAAHAVAALSPLTAVLHYPPEAGTGTGMTGDIPLPPASEVLALQGALAVGLLLAAIWIIRHDPLRRRGNGNSAFGRWGASIDRPLLSVDLLLLRRRGWLFSPLVMAVMPVLALAYMRLDNRLESLVHDLCALFLWCGTYSAADTNGAIMPVVMGTIGAQLFLHPGGLAGLRSFSREHAAGRLDELWLTPVTTRRLVRDRYSSVLAPFVVFVTLAAGPTLVLGFRLAQWPSAVAGLMHWLAVVLLLPAVVLATTVRQDWRGQGLGVVLGLEAGRLWLSAHPLWSLGPATGMLVANGLLLAVAVPATWLALRLAVRRLDRLRVGA